MIEELNEQIKKLQDVVIEYAKSDDETQILKYNGTSDNSALIVKDSKKDPKQVEKNDQSHAPEKAQNAHTTNRTKQVNTQYSWLRLFIIRCDSSLKVQTHFSAKNMFLITRL